MNTTTLVIIGGIILMATLYFLKDTICEGLSGGKSFMPNEMKGFSGSRKSKPQSSKLKLEDSKLFNVLYTTAVVIIVILIVVKVGGWLFFKFNF